MERKIVVYHFNETPSKTLLEKMHRIYDAFHDRFAVVIDAPIDRDEYDELAHAFEVDDVRDLSDVISFEATPYSTEDDKKKILADLHKEHPNGFFV